MSFATIADVEARLGVDLDVAGEAKYQSYLDQATAAIRAATGRWITAATATMTRLGSGESRMELPEWPVDAVLSVEWSYPDQDTWTEITTGWYQDRNSIVMDRDLALRPGVRAIWDPWLRYRVVFTFGFATVPDVVRYTCLEMALRGAALPPGAAITNERIGSYGVTYAVPQGGGGVWISDRELRELRRYLRVPGASSAYIGRDSTVAAGPGLVIEEAS